MTDSTTTNVSSKTIPYQDVARDIDIDTTLGLDPWRPLQSGDINQKCFNQLAAISELNRAFYESTSRRRFGVTPCRG